MSNLSNRLKQLKYLWVLCLFIISNDVFSQATILRGPSDGDACVSVPVVFNWDQVIGNVANYSIQVSYSNTFSAPFAETGSTASLTYTSLSLSPNIVYYWRVGTNITGDNNSPYWTSSKSFTTKSSSPTLTSPVNVGCVQLSSTFNWSKVTGASLYKIQVSNVADYSSTQTQSLTFSNTFGAVSLPANFTNYFWRASASFNSGCQTDWSNTSSFTTIVGVPTNPFPSVSSSGNVLNTSLSWTNMSGASSYDLEYANNPSFSSSNTFGALSSNAFNSGTFSNYNTDYFWRVKSNGASCSSAWSSSNSFKTMYPSPTMTLPANGQLCVPMNAIFDWADVPGATGYEINIATNSNFLINNIVNSQTYTNSAAAYLFNNPSSTFFWRVRAKDANNSSDWSLTRSLVTAISSPDLQSPVSGTTGMPIKVNLKWVNVGQISNFNVQVSTDPTFASNKVLDTTMIDITKDVILNKYSTVYYWRARQTFGTCVSDWSPSRSFTTLIGYPNLILPANNSTTVTLSTLFKWSPVSGALSYDLLFSNSSSFTTVIDPSRSGVQNTEITLGGFQPNSTYYWKVRTNDPNGSSPWSPAFKFSTGYIGAEVPFLLSPAADAIKFPIDGKLVWKKAARALKYRVQISVQESFATLLVDSTTVVDTTFKVNNLPYYSIYYWRVASINDSGRSNYAVGRKFRTTAFAPTDLAKLLTPPNDTSNVKIFDILFTWSGVPRTQEYANNLDGGYQFQLSKVLDFATTVYDDKTWGTERRIYDLASFTTYYWRTRGWNEGGNGPWSTMFKFKTMDMSSVENGEQYDFKANVTPTPSYDNAKISFEIPNDGIVKVFISDNTGRVLSNIYNGNLSSGKHSFDLNTKVLASGVYNYTVQLGNQYQSGQLLITK